MSSGSPPRMVCLTPSAPSPAPAPFTSGTQEGWRYPVDLAQSAGSCQILDLVLGPLDLDLLGLEVHLDQVHLNISASPGRGNLRGNLLCAVAGCWTARRV